MPFNLGALAGGTAQGIGQGLNWANQYENARYLRDQRQLADEASKIWGRTMAQMGGLQQAPMAQPPMPGQASQPAAPPPPPQMAPAQQAPAPPIPMQYGANGVPMPPPKPPEFQQGGMPPPQQAQPQMAPAAQQGPPVQQQAPMGAPHQGQVGLVDTLQNIMRANPGLDPNNPKDMRALVAAAGQALPFMKQGDQEYYRMLTLAMQQQRVNQGEDRLEVARERAATQRDQGWERIRQSAERLASSADIHRQNIEINREKLEQARQSGDTRRANLIERQIENDTKSLTGYTNAYSRLLQSTTPSQREDPAIAADIAELQLRIQGARGTPAPEERRRGGIGQAEKPSGPRHEDAASPAPKEYPKVGQVVNRYKLVKPDFTKDDSWIYVGAGTPEVPKAGERPEVMGGP